MLPHTYIYVQVRLILKDFVNGKLLYVYPPPDREWSMGAEAGASTDSVKGAFAVLDGEEEEEDRKPSAGVFDHEMMRADAVNATLEQALAQNEERLKMLNN